MVLQSTRILLIEDEPAHAEAIVRSLEGVEGAEIRVMTSLQAFRDHAEAWGPDIALMDLNLPDGRATEVLADTSGTRPFPVIVMTSYGSEQTAVEAMKCGALDYLVKSPETFNSLPRTLEQLLREWKIRVEQKRAEEALAKSRAELKAIYDHIPLMMCVVDSDRRVLYANPAFTTFTGATEEELKGGRACGIFGCINALNDVGGCGFGTNCQECPIRLAMDDTLQTGVGHQNVEYCTTIVQNGNSRESVLLGSTALFKEAGEAHMLLCLHDITSRKQAEDALQESKQYNEQVIRSAQEGVIVYDHELRYQVWNPYMEQLSGISASEVLGRHPLEVFPFLKDAGVIERLERALEGEVVGSADFPYQVPTTGKSGWTTDRSGPFRNAKGEIIGVIGTVSDITDRRRTENALRESEERHRLLADNASDVIWTMDLEGRFTYVSPSVERLRGYTQAEVMRQTLAEALTPESARVAKEGLANSVESLTSGQTFLPFRGELEQPCKDGSTVWTEVTTTGMRNQEGVFIGILGVTRDITDRRRTEGEKVKLQTQLQHAQKLESLGSLAGGVAHDMNNVLGAILGLASANIQAQPVGSPAQHAFKTIIKAAERGGKMVKGLLSFARQSPAEDKELDLNAVLLEQVHLLEHTTLSRVSLKTDLVSNLRSIRGDASALSHAFMNLCINAKDAMHDGGTLTLRTRNLDSNWIQVEVEDTGSGMSNDVLARALDPFFTTKEVGKGTGLGLSMVYSTVKAHQGLIDIESELGRGTCVKMRFPISKSMIQTTDASATIPLTTPFRTLSVLVVDDDELIQSTMVAMLDILNHSVSKAWSGEEALVRLEGGLVPDAVILDMNMPGLGGAGTLPRLRALLPTLPVFLATGRVDESALQLTRKYPHVTLLSKPFSMMELQQHLAALG